MAAFIAVDIENEIYKHFKDEKSYQNKMRSILFNLRDPKN
jgi:hypothetical protein